MFRQHKCFFSFHHFIDQLRWHPGWRFDRKSKIPPSFWTLQQPKLPKICSEFNIRIEIKHLAIFHQELNRRRSTCGNNSLEKPWIFSGLGILVGKRQNLNLVLLFFHTPNQLPQSQLFDLFHQGLTRIIVLVEKISIAIS